MATQPPLIERLARAFMTMQRNRLGLPEREMKAQEAMTQDALRQAQLAEIRQRLGLKPAEQASEIDARAASAEAARAQADLARATAGQRKTPKAGTPHYETDAAGNVTAIVPQPDGSFKQVPVGPVGTARREPAGGAEGFAANPFLTIDKRTGEQRLAVRVKGGGLKWVDEIEGTPVAPGPTADMRNVEFQSQAVEPAFELVGKSLDSLEAATTGIGGKIAGIVPGTSANFAKSRFQEQAKALLGAIVARQAGEGSRLSDEDRRAYSQAATLVNNLILLPGGIEEARARLNDAKTLLDTVMQRRRGGMNPAGAATPLVQRNRRTGEVRHSLDGGATWRPGPPSQ